MSGGEVNVQCYRSDTRKGKAQGRMRDRSECTALGPFISFFHLPIDDIYALYLVSLHQPIAGSDLSGMSIRIDCHATKAISNLATNLVIRYIRP